MTLNEQNKFSGDKPEQRAAHTTLETVQIEKGNARMQVSSMTRLIVFGIGAAIVIALIVLVLL